MLAKEELGADAVVMNVKTNAPKGIYKLFRKTTVEITAALDENIVYQSKKEAPKRNPDIIYDEEPAVVYKPETAIEQKLDKLQDMLENQMSEHSRKQGEDDMRQAGEEDEDDSNIACMQLIYNQMVANEVDEQYANQVIGEIENKLKKNAGVNNILMSMYQKLVLKLGQIKTIELDDNQVKYIFFVGPTGVGKTTTIAKIASMLKMNQKKKVALMTADTYRIAAVEQLTTYANILDIPLRVIYSADEVAEARNQAGDYDVILVDTAGRSHKNREQRAD